VFQPIVDTLTEMCYYVAVAVMCDLVKIISIQFCLICSDFNKELGAKDLDSKAKAKDSICQGQWKKRKPKLTMITKFICTVNTWQTQPFIPPGSVNEYQLRLGRQRQVWFIPLADVRGVCR